MSDHGTEVLARGGFKRIDTLRRLLAGEGLRAQVVCPPGVNPNG